jgi:hypothetical protein
MIDMQVKDLYLEGKTVLDIEKIVNRSKVTVISWLRQLGVYDRNRDYVKFKYTNLDFFHTVDTELKSYWLGFIYADGCVFSKPENHIKRFSIDLGIIDKSHLEKLANIFSKPIDQFPSSPHLVWLTVNGSQLYTDLINHGIEERKTYSNTTPVLNHIPDNLMNHFIRGFFDGDGWTHQKENHYKFGLCGTTEFLTELQKILFQKLQTKYNVPIYKKQIFELNYESQIEIIHIYNYLYYNSTIWLERKRDKFEEMVTKILLNESTIIKTQANNILNTLN